MGVALAACASSEDLYRIPLEDSPQRGPADAWVTMVEFADFQCPFCARAHPTVAELERTYGDDLRVVFKHFALPSHARALPAAVAAECAREQGQFWPLHDRLFETGQLADSELLAHAEALGLDALAFNVCRQGQEPVRRVDRDYALGTQAGVDGTPTFVVNGRVLVGALPIEDFRALIDQELQRARESGIPKADYYRRAVLGEP